MVGWCSMGTFNDPWWLEKSMEIGTNNGKHLWTSGVFEGCDSCWSKIMNWAALNDGFGWILTEHGWRCWCRRQTMWAVRTRTFLEAKPWDFTSFTAKVLGMIQRGFCGRCVWRKTRGWPYFISVTANSIPSTTSSSLLALWSFWTWAERKWSPANLQAPKVPV